jgi:Sugar phosphate isomerases/epimerases
MLNLDIQMSWWAMSGLSPDERMEEKFERISQAGFSGVFARLPQPEYAKEWIKGLEQYSLSYGIQSFPTSADELLSIIQNAKALGATYVNAQVGNYYMRDNQAILLLNQLVEVAISENFPCFIETHRGTVTQDLLRTIDYINAIPNLRLTIDLSHYVTAGEIVLQEHREQAMPYFEQLLKRTGSIHGRISGGQQIQSTIGGNNGISYHPAVNSYIKWWASGMRHWKESVKTNQSFLPVVCELGPPDYAITCFDDNNHREISDRWKETLHLRELLKEAWELAQ